MLKFSAAAVLLLLSSPAAAQPGSTAACDNSYAQSMRMVCGAPVRRYSAQAIARCEAEMAQHRERCYAEAAQRDAFTQRNRNRIQQPR